MEADHKDNDPSVSEPSAQLTRDASNLSPIANEEDGRAAKRIKMDNSTSPSNGAQPDQHVPGEGLHDAPPATENSKAERAEDDRDSRRGVAPIKKE